VTFLPGRWRRSKDVWELWLFGIRDLRDAELEAEIRMRSLASEKKKVQRGEKGAKEVPQPVGRTKGRKLFLAFSHRPQSKMGPKGGGGCGYRVKSG